jgi:3-oxoadipate enol-lactonase
MPHIQINDAHYYYERHGQGKSIVLIAGYSCDSTFWEGVTKELIQHFEVITFDNRAVGQTRDNGSTLTLEIMASETLALIQALNIQHPILVGHSMGGIIAQIIAKTHPELMERLIVLNSAPSISIRSRLALESFVTLLKEEAPIGTVIDASMPWFFSNQFLSDPKNIQLFKDRLMSNPHPQTLTDLERQCHALLQFEGHKWTHAIIVPTWVMSSDEDIICTPSESEGILKSARQTVFTRIPGGHSSPIESPLEVARIILRCANGEI